MFSPQTLTMFVILAAKGKIRRDHDQRQHKQSWSLLRSTICVLTRFDESRFSTPGRNAAFKSVQKIKGDLNKACSCSSDISTQPILNRAFKVIKGIKLIYRTFFFFIFQMKRKENIGSTYRSLFQQTISIHIICGIQKIENTIINLSERRMRIIIPLLY